jgi:hypothetical protein
MISTRRSSDVVARFFVALVDFCSWIISSIAIFCSNLIKKTLRRMEETRSMKSWRRRQITLGTLL